MRSLTDRQLAAVRESISSYIDGQIGSLETCWFLHGQSFTLSDGLFTKDDRRFLTAITSETDGLPMGKLQKLWHPDVLPEKLAEIAAYESRIKPQLLELCERLLVSLNEEVEARNRDWQLPTKTAETI